MNIKVRFILPKVFGLSSEYYEVNDVSDETTIRDLLKELASRLGSEFLLKIINEGGREIIILVNDTTIGDLSITIKSLRDELKGCGEVTITIAPAPEGGY